MEKFELQTLHIHHFFASLRLLPHPNAWQIRFLSLHPAQAFLSTLPRVEVLQTRDSVTTARTIPAWNGHSLN